MLTKIVRFIFENSLTGQNTDPLLYKYLQELIDYLKGQGFLVGIRTNGVLALEKIREINSINDKVSLSIHSLTPTINKRITNHSTIPDWDRILKQIKVPLRIAIVVTRYNKNEILNLIKFFSKYKKINYIQLRCIATDERYEELKEDIKCYKEVVSKIMKKYSYVRDFYTASIYDVYGIEVCLWKTVATTINSYNYFTDGTWDDMDEYDFCLDSSRVSVEQAAEILEHMYHTIVKDLI